MNPNTPIITKAIAISTTHTRLPFVLISGCIIVVLFFKVFSVIVELFPIVVDASVLVELVRQNRKHIVEVVGAVVVVEDAFVLGCGAMVEVVLVVVEVVVEVVEVVLATAVKVMDFEVPCPMLADPPCWFAGGTKAVVYPAQD